MTHEMASSRMSTHHLAWCALLTDAQFSLALCLSPIKSKLLMRGFGQENTAPALAGLLGLLGLFAAPLVAYSEWTLRFTGQSFPSGPQSVCKHSLTPHKICKVSLTLLACPV